MNLAEATKFFAEFFGGEHHIPDYRVYELGGGGFYVKCQQPLATYDNNALTRLVFMAHDQAMRVEIVPTPGRYFKIAIWKRKRLGDYFEKHPTIDEALDRWRRP